MKKTLLYLLIIVLAVIMATISCASTGNNVKMETEISPETVMPEVQNNDTLIEIKWILTQVYNPENISSPDFSEMKLLFKNEEEISGFGGSNIFFGQYMADGKNIKFGLLGSTKMSTPFDIFEMYYMSLFETLKTYSIDNGILSIYGEDVNIPIMIFTAKGNM